MMTRTRNSIGLSLIVSGILLAVAWSAPAKVTSLPLRDNPYRNAGGSCVYDRTGKLVHAPKGSACKGAAPAAAAPGKRSRQKRPPGDPHAGTGKPGIPGFLEDHQHIAEEIGLLRVSIARGNRDASLESVDRILDELIAHVEREEKLFKSLSSQKPSK